MNKKSFTLLEILVGLIIIAILASLSIASYRKTIETNDARICKENLKVLQAAIDIYTLENNSLPLTMAQLTPRQIYLAYSRVAAKAKENHLLSSLRKILGIKPALAQNLPPLPRYYGNNRNVFRCPADAAPNVVTSGECNVSLGGFDCGSYSFNFTNETFDSFTNRLIKTGTYALIYDSSSRHRRPTGVIQLGITSGGTVGKNTSSGQVVEVVAD